MKNLDHMSDKRLIRWYARRKLCFNYLTHLYLWIVENTLEAQNKEQMKFSIATSYILKRASPPPEPPSPPDPDSWKANKQMMELMSIALGDTNNALNS